MFWGCKNFAVDGTKWHHNIIYVILLALATFDHKIWYCFCVAHCRSVDSGSYLVSAVELCYNIYPGIQRQFTHISPLLKTHIEKILNKDK